MRACVDGPDKVLQLQKLGTRAVVAEVLVQKAEKVARTVEHLLDAGAEGDLAAAKALVPWIDQAYGKPTERVEHKYPTSVEEIGQMDEEQLERLVAEGRRGVSRVFSRCRTHRIGVAAPRTSVSWGTSSTARNGQKLRGRPRGATGPHRRG